jgi:hypothetical protein
MKFSLSALFAAFILIIAACNNEPAIPKSLCSDPCLKDTLKYTIADPGNPYVYISAKQCSPDTILWSTKYSETNRKLGIVYTLGQPVNINKDFISCFIQDTSFALLQFNDCTSFRGYILRLPFNKQNNIRKISSAFTNFDKKFKIGDGLICYADYTFLYVEDILTGKKEQLKLADKQLTIDWENIHATFDSVNVTRNRIFVNFIENNEVKPLEKTISL